MAEVHSMFNFFIGLICICTPLNISYCSDYLVETCKLYILKFPISTFRILASWIKKNYCHFKNILRVYFNFFLSYICICKNYVSEHFWHEGILKSLLMTKSDDITNEEPQVGVAFRYQKKTLTSSHSRIYCFKKV